MLDISNKIKYWEMSKLEESQILEQFQKIRQMILKSGTLDYDLKKHIDNELDPVIDNTMLIFSELRNRLDNKDKNIGNIIEK